MKDKKGIPLHIVLDIVSEYYDCSKGDVFSRTRKRELLIRKQWFQYLARILNTEHKITLRYIGNYYSDVTGIKYDHAAVLNNIKTISGYIETYSKDKDLEEYFIKHIKIKYMEELLLANKKPKVNSNSATCQQISFKVTKTAFRGVYTLNNT